MTFIRLQKEDHFRVSRKEGTVSVLELRTQNVELKHLFI